MNTTKPENFDQYISSFSKETQELLQQIRNIIKNCATEASEKISYGIPTFYLKGNLVHFAAYKNHIGFYPGSSGILKFEKEISGYKSSKGTVQFPINETLPFKLIEQIVKFRVAENLSKK